MLLFSCNNENLDQEFADDLEKDSFTKYFQIVDDRGNSVNFSLSADEEDLIDDFTLDNFELVTTEKDLVGQSTQVILDESPIDEDEEEWPEAKLTLHIESFEFDQNITGFDVRFKDDELQANQRTSQWFSRISFTANGIIGAGWEYVEESCSRERIQIQFHARNRCFLCSWKKLYDNHLYSPGNEATYTNSSIGEKYSEVRRRLRTKRECSGERTLVVYYWIL